ncbi:putative nuclease HARBI1 [Myripristis murdjan]|nr:putative nuclease HARBI1 [Myripristis murdjan]
MFRRRNGAKDGFAFTSSVFMLMSVSAGSSTMEPEACAGLLFSFLSWYKLRQEQRDQQVETERRRRRRLVAAARRRRLERLREEWRRRETRCRRRRLRRFRAHDTWMKAISHYYLRNRMRRRPKVWFYPRSSDWWENTAAAFTDDQWLQHFRVSRKTFSYICTTLRPQLKRQDTTYRLCIPLQKRVALALYKLANPCDYKTVADLFAVGVASVCRCVHEFCRAVIQVLKPQLVVAPNHAGLAEMADHFYQTYGIPQCIGVIDSIHIPIIRPPHYQSEQPNGDGYLAIVLQAVVDGKGILWDLSMGCPRWVNESGEVEQSWVCDDFPCRMLNICGTDSGHFIIGSAQYPAQNWLLKPYPDTGWLSAEQELFNTQISAAHGVAEHAFGRLKGRWKCLSKRNDCNIEVVKDMVETCCVLHNLCEKNTDAFLPEWKTVDQPQPLNGKPQRESESDSWLALQQFMQDNAQ